MTTVFVDLVNLDGSRPEGRLRFSLEQLRVGDPDVVPSSVEVVILDGKARVENLLPGEMKVLVSTGRWSKEWPVAIPDDGTHDLFKLLGEQAREFEHALWATLLGRVEALESAPRVDLAPLEKRVGELESKPDPHPVDLAPLEDATRQLDNRVTVLEGKPEPAPFDPAELTQQLADMQAKLSAMPNFTPVDLIAEAPDEDSIWDETGQIYGIGGSLTATMWMGRVNITLGVGIKDYTVQAFEEGMGFSFFPTPIGGNVTARVWLESPTAYRPVPAGYLYIEWVDGKLSITDRVMGATQRGNLRQALEDGYTNLRIEIEYFTTDTN